MGCADADQCRKQYLRDLAALAHVAIEHVRVDRQVDRLAAAQGADFLGIGCGRPGKKAKNENRQANRQPLTLLHGNLPLFVEHPVTSFSSLPSCRGGAKDLPGNQRIG